MGDEGIERGNLRDLHERFCEAIAAFMLQDHSGMEQRVYAALSTLEGLTESRFPKDLAEPARRILGFVRERDDLDGHAAKEAFELIKNFQRLLNVLLLRIKKAVRPGHRHFDILEYAATMEVILAHQARAAGLIGHPGQRGQARETFVREFLNRFLPPTIRIGSGEIVDGIRAGASRQQDVLLYRANFPIIDLAASQIFLAEGVLGTVEVKSFLDGEELTKAWRNIASVRAMEPSLLGASAQPLRFVGGDFELDGGLSKEVILAKLRAGMSPGSLDPLLDPPSERIRCSLFAFSAVGEDAILERMKSLAGQFGSWDGAPDCVCVLGQSFGMATHDDTLDKKGAEGFKFRPAKPPLGWFLAYLWRGLIGRPERLPPLRPYFTGGEEGAFWKEPLFASSQDEDADGPAPDDPE